MYAFIIALLIVLCIFLGYVAYINFKKCEKLEEINEKYVDVFDYIRDSIIKSDVELRKIDDKGSFEADDEVGFFFKELKKIQEKMNELVNLFN